MDNLVETVAARGHEHVAATHASTFEVTTDDWLTPAGDCIVGVEADRAPPDLTFASDRSLVVRTSDYVDDRTVAVGADAAAADLDRSLVRALADGAALTVRLRVEC